VGVKVTKLDREDRAAIWKAAQSGEKQVQIAADHGITQ
jgi:hypothetical protein